MHRHETLRLVEEGGDTTDGAGCRRESGSAPALTAAGATRRLLTCALVAAAGALTAHGVAALYRPAKARWGEHGATAALEDEVELQGSRCDSATPPGVPGARAEINAWAADLVGQMTKAEKWAMVRGTSDKGNWVGRIKGVPRLAIPPLTMQDGPQGFRPTSRAQLGQVTSWPCALAVAATWDAGAMRRWAQAMGQEFKARGASIALGPGVNVNRVAVNGRNAEYLSGEDAYLGAKLVVQFVEGMQGEGVAAVVKHFVNNEQEEDRTLVDIIIDERTLWEVYYPPFQAAVDAGVASVMCSYNSVNGQPACENSKTIQEDLKKTMGFDGWVMSDWDALKTGLGGVAGGTDQDLPSGNFFTDEVLGHVPSTRLDGMVQRVLQGMARVWSANPSSLCAHGAAEAVAYEVLAGVCRTEGGGAGTYSSHPGLDQAGCESACTDGLTCVAYEFSGPGTCELHTAAIVATEASVGATCGLKSQGGKTAASILEQHRTLAQDLASQGAVLLKNEKGVLPLGAAGKVAVIGAACDARHHIDLDNWLDSDYYVVGGSGRVAARSATSVVQGLRKSNLALKESIENSLTLARQALAESQVAVVCGGAASEENSDRKSLLLQEDNFIAQVLAMASEMQVPAVVVALAPGPILMSWRHEASAVLLMFLSGERTGDAAAAVMTGQVNPSAKLPVTIPVLESDAVPHCAVSKRSGHNTSCEYSERLLGGWHWYDGKEVAYPFGHGLSYTTFEYSAVEGPSQPDEDGRRRLSVQVRNTGRVDGSEVVQLYLDFPPEAGMPRRVLRGFAKTPVLRPDESHEVVLELTERDLSTWDVGVHGWRMPPPLATFQVMIGASSQDIRLGGSFSAEGAGSLVSATPDALARLSRLEGAGPQGGNFSPDVLTKSPSTADPKSVQGLRHEGESEAPEEKEAGRATTGRAVAPALV
ncbi:unnamed protein product [Prorocentrum cordatum]|uniref:Probable beta-glucosidase G n=1 Tax=Prorocentrum cordatum TaxID=2364126 RepID=A0ABN9UET3_9DINO|nr:unnamed protein product [Polarella glacialis]